MIRTAPPISEKITPVTDFSCQLAENPLWDAARNCIYWTDIVGGKLHKLDLATRQCQEIYQGPTVGGFTLQENGDLLLFRVRDIATLERNGRLTVKCSLSEEGMVRFNDVVADPGGAVFAGTIGETNTSGGLYRLDRGGEFKSLFRGTSCSNGMGFSPDQRTFYWTCSTTRQIFQFDYDPSSGEISNRRLFHRVEDKNEIPDGLAVDAEGCLWSARWGGSQIVRYDPGGSVIGRIEFPVPEVSSLCFAGPGLNEIFVTTAQQPGVALSGHLFHVRTQAVGLKRPFSRIDFC